MQPGLRRSLEALLDEPIASARPVAGGDIGDSFRIELASGERCFVKCYRGVPARLARCEAEGLAWLAEAGCLPVARPLAVATEQPLLVLEWIEAGPRAHDFDEALGRGLAALHASGAEGFGLREDNFIGPLPQSNERHASWPEFYGEERLRPLLRHAREAGRLGPETARRAELLIARLPQLCGPEERPSRLHGDLWSGNLLVDARGQPCLIDPACHGGHREVDLAMMRLFGGFSERSFDAYAEHSPLAPGASERVALHQLYPLLVHLVLFGGGYASRFDAALRGYL